MPEQVDVVVIGLGVAGESVAARLLAGGLSVLAVEQDLVGGECKNWGCLPTKMMVRAGDVLAEAGRVVDLAGTARVAPDWSPVAARIRRDATHDWTDTAAVQTLTGKGMRLVRGRAVLCGPGRIRVDDLQVEAARAVVLATGTRPAVPPIEGLAGTPYWTNRDAARLQAIPDSVIVLGGGPVGVELGQVLARFGSRVTLVEVAGRLLGGEEPEASDVVARALTADGVDVRTASRAERIGYGGDGFRVSLAGGESLTAQRLLVAAGRHANLDGLGLETVGLDPDASVVAVDPVLRAGPLLWAIGDITGKGQFTHVATYQARIAADAILGGTHLGLDGKKSLVTDFGLGGEKHLVRDVSGADYRAVPRVVYTDPEIGAVGLTEAAARAQGIRVRIGSATIATSARGFIHGPGNAGLIKLVVDADRRVLVGATSASPAGGEVLGLLCLAVRAQTPLAILVDLIYAYPTFHRAIEDALRTLGHDLT